MQCRQNPQVFPTSYLGGFEFEAGLPWQRLEALTKMMIVSTDVKVHGANTINIPKANKCRNRNFLPQENKDQHGDIFSPSTNPQCY